MQLRQPEAETWFRLAIGAVDCERSGLKVAGVDLLDRRLDTNSHPTFLLPPPVEIERRLRRAYGFAVSVEAKRIGLQLVVDSLNKGELAFAQIAALHLNFPDPPLRGAATSPLELAIKLQRCGWLLKDWEPDKHPRTGEPPNPGWFAPTNGEIDAETNASDSVVGEQFAVRTSNFGYACRALGLDRNAASKILHQLKEGAGLQGDDNCTFDTETGDVYFGEEHIGNLSD